MLSLWKVREVVCCGDIFYEVYRTTNAAKKSEQIQKQDSYFWTRNEAEALARRLNTEAIV